MELSIVKKIRLLFAVDNGMGTNLKGTGLAAEYYFYQEILFGEGSIRKK